MLLVTFWWVTTKVMMFTAYVGAFWACALVPRSKWAMARVLQFIIGSALAVESIGMVAHFLHIRSSTMYNWFSVVEFVAILYLVYMFRSSWKRNLIIAGTAGLLAMALSAGVYWERPFLLIEGLLVMYVILVFTLMAALWHLANTSERPLHRVPEFWLFMAMLFFFGGFTPLIGLIRFIRQNDESFANTLWQSVTVLIVLRYAMTAYACRLAVRTGHSDG